MPKEQVDAIGGFFAAKHAAGMVRESKSPQSSPTFCVRKPNWKWRMVHALDKLNAATISASTPIPRKVVLQNNMVGCSIFRGLDMVDGYYQLLMRESDIPLTAVSTPSGMLWEWLVMPHGLFNAPATFNRLVTNSFGRCGNLRRRTSMISSYTVKRKGARRMWRRIPNTFGRCCFACARIAFSRILTSAFLGQQRYPF